MLLDQAGADLGTEVPHIAPRREFNEIAPRRQNALHCYGVDFLSNKEVLEIFSQFQPKEVEWLDDSSCNIVFPSDDTPPAVVRKLAGAELHGQPGQVWSVTKPLKVGGEKSQRSKVVKRVPLREFRLEIRVATEADRKDPGHSGHTDSVYYSHVKEQQTIQRQNAELARMKKRQRRCRFPSSEVVEQRARGAPASNEGTSPGSTSAATGEAPATAATGSDAQVGSTPASAATPRLGCGGLLDPLLFLRAHPSAGSGGTPDATSSGSGPPGDTAMAVDSHPKDLGASLRQSESEYAAVLRPGQPPPQQPEVGAGAANSQPSQPSSQRRPGREKHTNKAQGREQRGRKRRPVEQEPRPVSGVAPAPRGPQAFPVVEAFLKQHSVQCQRVKVERTFRSIIFGQQKKRTEPAEKPAAASDSLPPWEQYFLVNDHFVRRGQFMHTVAWEAEGRQILAVVPHPARVDTDRLARAVQRPVASLKQRKLKDISKDTGLPIFVCPPFGHPKDKEGRDPVILVDSTVTELKRPLLFDCGSVGLCVPSSEFVRSTGAACVEGLGKAPPKEAAKEPVNEPAKEPAKELAKTPTTDAAMAAPEPAPEPAPAILQEPEVRYGGGEDATMA